jgi:hypothetical protein
VAARSGQGCAQPAPEGLGLEGEDWREIVRERERGVLLLFLPCRVVRGRARRSSATFGAGSRRAAMVVTQDSAAGAGLAEDIRPVYRTRAADRLREGVRPAGLLRINRATEGGDAFHGFYR